MSKTLRTWPPCFAALGSRDADRARASTDSTPSCAVGDHGSPCGFVTGKLSRRSPYQHALPLQCQGARARPRVECARATDDCTRKRPVRQKRGRSACRSSLSVTWPRTAHGCCVHAPENRVRRRAPSRVSDWEWTWDVATLAFYLSSMPFKEAKNEREPMPTSSSKRSVDLRGVRERHRRTPKHIALGPDHPAGGLLSSV